MPRYLVERSFPEAFTFHDLPRSEKDHLIFMKNNALLGAAWIHSYISPNGKKSYCLYDAPSPEALRQAAQLNGLPVDRITEVSCLGPAALAAG